MRRFRPLLEPLEGKVVPSGSGATAFASGGVAYVVGSPAGDTVRIFDVPQGGFEVEVSNPRGTDAFVFSSSDLLEFVGGSGTNDVTSTASGTEILIGGPGDNTVRGGSGFTFEVSTGSGSNTLFAGSSYTTFVAASRGETHMVAGGQFCSASLCLGVNTYDAGALDNQVYVYGGSDAVNGRGQNNTDVYEYAPVTVDPGNDPNVREHRFF